MTGPRPPGGDRPSDWATVLDVLEGEVLAARASMDADRHGAGVELQHAQDIVLELQSSLRVDAWEGGPRLAALYTWLVTELVQANVRGDRNRVASCLQVVEPLRDAWRQAAASLASTA